MAEQPVKRLRYFTGQFLEALDFEAEQTYHSGAGRRGNRALYAAGILDNGFVVAAASDPARITVSPGTGVDALGRQIAITDTVTVSLPPAQSAQRSYFVTVGYEEVETDQQTPDADVTDNTRIEERPRIEFFVNQTDFDMSLKLIIARLTVGTDGHLVGAIDASVGQLAGMKSKGLTVACDPRADDKPSLSRVSLSNRGPGGAPVTWSLYSAAVGGGWGVTPNAFEIWSYETPRKQFELRQDGTTLLAPSGGRVGIGTNALAQNSKLNVSGGAVAITQAQPGLTRADASVHVVGAAGGFGRLTQMIPEGASQPALNLLGSRGAAGAEQWWSWGASADNKWRIRVGTDLGGDDGLTIDAGGQVGVGTAAPTNKLHVAGEIRQNSLYLSGGPGGSSLSYNAFRRPNNSWNFADPSRTAMTLEIDDAGGNGTGRFDVYSTTIARKNVWTHRMRIEGESGNVGIGTQSPGNFRLMVSGGDTRIAAPGAEQGLFGLDKLVGLNDLRFYVDDTGTSEAMRLASNGLSILMADSPYNVAFTNTLRAKNIVKAWGLIQTVNTPTILDGFNIESIALFDTRLVIRLMNVVGNLCITGSLLDREHTVVSFRPSSPIANNVIDAQNVDVTAITLTLDGSGSVRGSPIHFQNTNYRLAFIVMGTQ